LNKYTIKSNLDKSQKFEDQTLNDLMEKQDDDYKYRLVGINIHSGTGKGGHYWSIINTNRDIDGSAPKWEKVEDDHWRKFDDSRIDVSAFSRMEGEAFGGDQSRVAADDLSQVEYGWGKSAYMLVYERKTKRDIRQVDPETQAATVVKWNEVEPVVPDWIRDEVTRDNQEFVIDRQVFHLQFFQLVKLIMDHTGKNMV
jgi:hypothetical protein